jgi:hypothetical protein
LGMRDYIPELGFLPGQTAMPRASAFRLEADPSRRRMCHTAKSLAEELSLVALLAVISGSQLN